jgi:hypothetical protein
MHANFQKQIDLRKWAKLLDKQPYLRPEQCLTHAGISVSNPNIAMYCWSQKSTVPSLHADGWNSLTFPNVSLENHCNMKGGVANTVQVSCQLRRQRCRLFDARVEGVSKFRPPLPWEQLATSASIMPHGDVRSTKLDEKQPLSTSSDQT